MVIRKIKEHILTYENLNKLVHLVNEGMDAAAGECRERLKVISVEIDNVNQCLERLYEALKTGSLQLADLEKVRNYVEDLRILLEESPLAERKSFIKSFVREVRVIGTKSC